MCCLWSGCSLELSRCAIRHGRCGLTRWRLAACRKWGYGAGRRSARNWCDARTIGDDVADRLTRIFDRGGTTLRSGQMTEHSRAPVGPGGCLLALLLAAANGCSKPSCEETLTCPPAAGASKDAAGASGGGTAGTKTAGSGGSAATDETAGNDGGAGQQGGATGTDPRPEQGGTSHQETGGEGGTPPDVCENGSCTSGGTCAPEQRRCDAGSGVPQLCTQEREWENQARCRTDQVCAGGECLCRAEFTTCGDECVTVEDNPKHCGRCGHDCLGGECTGGKCMPLELAYGQGHPQDLALDASYVYWIDAVDDNGSSVRRVAKRGGTVQVLATEPTRISGLAVAEGRLYWQSYADVADPLGIFASDVDGTNLAKFADAPAVVDRIGVRNDTLFWNQRAAEGEIEIYSKALDSDAEPRLVPSDADIQSAAFAAAGNCIFYATADSQGGYYLRQSCGDQPSAVRFNTSKGITLSANANADSSNLYFGAEGRGIMRLPLAGSASATALVSGRKFPDVIVDGDQIYYIEGDNGSAQNCTSNWTIYRMPAMAGATPIAVVSPPQECAAFLATDESAVYWTNSTVRDGSIHLVAK